MYYKKNLFLLLVFIGFSLSSSQPPAQPQWKDFTTNLKKLVDQKSKALATAIKNNQIDISLVQSVILGKSPKKLNIILLYQQNDENKDIYINRNNTAYQAFQRLGIQLRNLIKFPNNEVPDKIELISIGYEQINDDTVKALRELFSLLLDINTSSNYVKNITYAFGETAHLVNRISHFNNNLFKQKKTKKHSIIDTMIHIQSPIYEWYWSTIYRGYYQEKKWTPIGFRRLYNLYTKASIPTQNVIQYPDRKYRQQARKVNNRLIMPVKNIRAIKLSNNTLYDVTIKDMNSAAFIDKVADTIEASEQYLANFDFLGNIYTDQNPKYKPVLIINRFITEIQNNILIQYGDSTGQQYKVAANISEQELKNIKKAFTQDVDISAAQLINLIDIPIQQDLKFNIVWTGLKTDIERITHEQNNIKTNSLYLLETKPILNEAYIKSQLSKLASDKLPMNYILNKIYLGGVYAYQLLYGNPKQIPTQTQEEYIESIIALMWYLFSTAINKDQGYIEGSFIIRDYNGKVFNFLMDYAKKVNKTLTGSIKDSISTDNPFAYARLSSHFKQYQNKYKVYGIDIRKGAQGSALPLLPAEKRHILFNQIEDGKTTFIKMENYGVYGLLEGTIPHTKEFIIAQAKKIPTLRTQFGLGSDDDPLYRKERIPADFINKIKEILTKANYPKQIQQIIETKVNQDGIQAISENYIEKNNQIFFPETVNKQAQQAFKQEIQKLRAQLTKEYDHLNYRYGREVILTPRELYSSLYYYLVKTDNNLKNQFKNFAESIIKKQPINFNLDLVKQYYDGKTMQILSDYIQELKK